MKFRAFFKPGTLLFIALWLVLMIGGRSRFFQDPGTFWHTVVGRQIMTERSFFDTDQFTFTFAGKTWIPHQWLGECLMAVAHAIDGFDTLLLMTATILAALFTWLGARLMRCGLHYSLSIVLVGLAVAASSGHFHVRPHLATIVGMAILVAMLTDFEAGRIGINRLYWLLPMFWIWSNMHGGALGGTATFAIAVTGWTVLWTIGWESPIKNYRDLGKLFLIWLACCATALLNPYGRRLPQVWLEIYEMKSLPRLIQEHAAINVADPNAWMIVLLGLVYIGILATTFPGRPRIVWLLPLLWFFLTCQRIRHAPLFAVSALIALADFFPRTSIVRGWVAKGSDLFTPPPAAPKPIPLLQRMAAWLIPFVLVLVTLLMQAGRASVPVVGHGWARLDPAVWPTGLLDELKNRQHDRPGGTRIFNEYGYGGFLIYHAPGFRVFADDRCELFGDVWLSDFIDARGNDPGGHLERWQEQYGDFDYALVFVRDEGFYPYFAKQPSWAEVKRTDDAVLFVRKNR